MWDWWRKYRSVFLGILLILAALLWYSISLRQQQETNLLEKTVLTLTGPMQRGFDTTISGLAGAWTHYLYLVDTVEKNEQLEAENKTLRATLIRLDEISLENQRLRRLLDFKETQEIATLPAQVIAEDATSWFRTVMIDKGTQHGVVEGLPVVVADGVVGRVVRVGAKQARVLLITDASSAVATLIQHNRARGVCRGQGDSLTFDFVLRQEQVAVGDRVVTSGMGGVFPKGLVIGTVEAFDRKEFGLFQAVRVAPTVDFSHLEEVMVLLRETE